MMNIRHTLALALSVAVLMAGVHGAAVKGDDGGRLLTIDHYVGIQSTVPAIRGQSAQNLTSASGPGLEPC